MRCQYLAPLPRAFNDDGVTAAYQELVSYCKRGLRSFEQHLVKVDLQNTFGKNRGCARRPPALSG